MPKQPNASAAPARSAFRRRRLIVVAGVLVLGFAIWRVVFSAATIPDEVVVLSGRIEGDDSAIAPKTGGRIAEIRFREGESVRAGETIAVLDDEQVRAREEQARAALAVSEARERAARQQLATLQEQLQQAAIQTSQARTDAEGRVTAFVAGVSTGGT